MIRILFVFGDLFRRGGTETVMRQIFDHIDQERFRIDFLLMSDEPDDTELTRHIESCGSRVYHIVRRGKDYKRHKAELRKFFEEHEYDIVHTHMDAIGDEALAEAKRAGVKVRVAHSHNTDQLPNPKSLKDHLHKAVIRYERGRLRKLATHFVACSTEAGEWLFGAERCSGERYLLFRNAIDPEGLVYSAAVREKVRKELGISDECVLGHVGTFNFQKNHEFLVRVFAEVRKELDARKSMDAGKQGGARLVLVGTGSLEPEVRKRVAELGLTDSVLFLGNRGDVSELLQGMDAFVFPSRHEGLPLAAIEAQASGLYCFLSDRISGEVDITGLVKFLPIEEGSEARWAKEICAALDEKLERRSPTQRIREAGYDMGTNIRMLEEFYTKALEDLNP
jgi:glycosyltransferase involved in cell wall biosynthesis